MTTRYARFARLEQRPEPRVGGYVELGLRQSLAQGLRGHFAGVVHPLDAVIDDELVGAERGRDLGGQGLGRQHVGAPDVE